MQSEELEWLHDIVDDATQDLFSSYGFECRVAEGRLQRCDLATALGFTAPDMSGSLSLATDYPVARTLVSKTPGATEVEDWMAELTNQLLGRLQRSFFRRGVAISSGLPVVVQGAELSVLDGASCGAGLRTSLRRISLDRAVHVAGGVVRVRVKLALGERFVLQSPDEAIGECPPAGDPILF